MSATKHTFRAYDIRGLVNVDFTEQWVEQLGRACGTYFLQHGQTSAVVGRDCRPSSPLFHQALVRGFTATGVDVVSVGMVPTPALYFAVKHLNRAAGVMITASHNPSEYNGFKIWSGATTLYGEAIQDVRRIMESLPALPTQADQPASASGDTPASSPGTQGLYCEHDILPAYREAILTRCRLAPSRRPLKVVVDGGNGAGGLVLVDILRAMGAEVLPLFCEPDGTFPNHHPDPIVEDNMRQLISKVRTEGADLGIGLDGDADRLGAVDAQGRLLNGDELLAIYARDLLERQPGALVLADVKCSDRLFHDIRHRGGNPHMCVTGHSVVKAKMLETGAPLAGELSGHMFFAENWYGFDDALYGAARLLDILSRLPEALTALPGWPTAFSTREVQIPCPDEHKFTVVSKAQEFFGQRYPLVDVDGARVTFAHGWGLVRASNTQPVLVLRFEADSFEHLAEIRREMEENIQGWIASLVQ